MDGSSPIPARGPEAVESDGTPARGTATRRERAFPSLLIAAAALFFALFPATREPAAPIPFLIALVVFGLPHGAADGALLLRSAGALALPIGAAYLALLAAAALSLWFWPLATSLAFLLVAWVHFGAADAEEAMGRSGTALPRLGWAAGRGGLIIGLPFAVAPERAWAPFARLSELLGAEAPPVPAEILGRVGVAAALVALACLAAGTALAWRGGSRRPESDDLVETLLIVLLALAADPFFAVGAYFLLVHGFKQSVAAGRRLEAGGGLSERLGRLHLAAVPLLVPSWIALAVLAWRLEAGSAFDLAALSLALYIVATPPHELLQRLLPLAAGGRRV